MSPLGSSASAVATVLTLALGTAGPASLAAAPTGDPVCAFRITATHVLAELDGDTSERAETLRTLLRDSGVGTPGFIPARCRTGQQDDEAGDEAGGDTGGQDDGAAPGAGGGTGEGDAGEGGAGQTAAQALGWGQPSKVDDFENGVGGWSLYDGPGHAGNGTRSPDAASVENGVLTINGTGDGTTAGMAWGDGQQYGRWEGRMKAPTGSPSYNALFLLWPDAENFPVGGEIDFAEISDASRKKVDIFLHYGEDNSQVQGDVEVDATQWNNWALEWTPDGVTAFLNGKEWWKTTDTSILPPGPMHLCIQLDWFPKGDSETGQMQVDWVKQWSLDGGADFGNQEPGQGSGSQGSGSQGSGSQGSGSQGSGGDSAERGSDDAGGGDPSQDDPASGSQ